MLLEALQSLLKVGDNLWMQVAPRPSWDARFTAMFTGIKYMIPLVVNNSLAREMTLTLQTPLPSNVANKTYQIRVAKKQLPGILKRCSQDENGNRTMDCDWISLIEENNSNQDTVDASHIPEGPSHPGSAWKNSNQKKIILYLHGGGYIALSQKSHRSIVGNIVKNNGYPVISLNYRLAPEHRFPAALFDAVYTYLYLIDEQNGLGYKPENVLIAGDSAGGALSIATCCYLRDHQLAMPAAIIALSPWVTPVEKEKRANQYDYVDNDDYRNNPIKYYLGNYTIDNPYITITNASLVNLPPLLVQYGEVETLRHQIEALTSKYQKTNQFVRAEIYTDMPHVFQPFDFHSSAQIAFKNIGRFIRDLESGNIQKYEYRKTYSSVPSNTKL